MKQILNILRKDLRRFWREIAASLALLATYSWNDVRGWSGDQNSGVGYDVIGALFAQRFLSGLVAALLPVAWAFLIVRVVQGEALVGDRQFWVTRPYEWKKLLVAKALFVVLTINLPLLLADFLLLAKAGFPPTHYIAGLLWMQLLLSLILILPMATLATVTASVVQTILAILGVALYGIGVGAVASVIPSSSFSGPVGSIEATLLIATCVVVIFWEYARRKTAAARWLIAALALVADLLLVATPYNAIVSREFPRLGPGEPPPVYLSPLPADPSSEAGVFGKEIMIQTPLRPSRMAENSIVIVSGVKVSLEAPDGLRWNSGWVSPGTKFFSDQTNLSPGSFMRTGITFTLKRSFFEQVKSEPVKARISLALTEYRIENRREFVIPPGEFLMPDVGICSAETTYPTDMEIHCRAPLRRPTSTLIAADLSATTCPAQAGESRDAPQNVREWLQNSDSGPADLGISPVKTFDLYLSEYRVYGARNIHTGICPGTRLVIGNPVAVRRIGTELEINSLRLADYRIPYDGTSEFGIVLR